jgi:hypothetical protein
MKIASIVTGTEFDGRSFANITLPRLGYAVACRHGHWLYMFNGLSMFLVFYYSRYPISSDARGI